jgi:hypothetical protein
MTATAVRNATLKMKSVAAYRERGKRALSTTLFQSSEAKDLGIGCRAPMEILRFAQDDGRLRMTAAWRGWRNRKQEDADGVRRLRLFVLSRAR